MTEHQVTTQAQQTTDFKRRIITARVVELVSIVTLVLLAYLASSEIGFAVLLGSMLYAIPQWVFSLLSLRFVGAEHSAGLFLSTMVGFTGKLVFVAFGCALIFTRYPGVAAGWLMATLLFLYVYGLILSSILIQLPLRR
ncbi:MAG: ATP synthase subunit I [Natronospirillum sp.]